MSRRLKNSPSSLAFTPDSVEKLLTQINASGSQTEAHFLALVTCSTTGKDQLAVLKQIGNVFKDNGGLHKKEDIYILTLMFMHCVARHPMRRSLSSMLQNVCEEHKGEVTIAMNKILQSILIFDKTSSFNAIRENIDLIASLMENFPLGDGVIRENNGLVLVYLDASLQLLTNTTRNEWSPMDQTKMMQHTLTTLKTIIAVLQKCEMLLSQQTNATNNEEYTSSINSIVSHSLHIMCDEYATLECRGAAAIVFPGVFCHIPEHFRKLFINLIYSGYKCGLPNSATKSSESNGLLDLRHLLRDQAESVQMQTLTSNSSGKVQTPYYNHTELTGISKILLDSICTFFETKVQLSSRLVLLHALLVKLPEGVLLQQLRINNDSTLFKELFINELIDITLNTSDKNILVLAFKTITLWMEKACHICKKYMNTDSLAEVTTEKLLPHLALYVDHYIDTIRHNVNTAIKDCFALLSSIHVDDFDKHVARYFDGVLNSRGRVSMLINICQFVSIRDILNEHGDLPGEIVSLLGDVNLASHGCDLYAIMCRKHFKEICGEKKNIKEWASIWIDTLYLKLGDKNNDMKANIVNFLIPCVLKIHPAIVNDILSDINTNPKMEMEKVRAVIVFLRCLRGMKNYVNNTGISFHSTISASGNSNGDHTWKNMIRIADMKKCLTHTDDQVRLDALSLICSSVKTTDPVDKEDIDLLQYFLCFNMASENPSFRHQVLTNLKKLCLRLFNHAFQFVKQNNQLGDQEGKHTGTVLNMYGTFLIWLTRFIFKHLYECAPYSQTSTSLSAISLITEIFDANNESELLNFYIFDEKEKVKFTSILMQCFNDTYEPNRVIAIEILKHFPIFCSFSDVDVEQIFTENLANLNSPKPDVSSIAAYYVSFLAVILKGKDTGFLYNCILANNIDTDLYFSDTSKSCAVRVLLDICLNLLKKQLRIAKLNLIRGCQDAPLYGVLYCMRLLFQLQDVEFMKAGMSSNDAMAGQTFTSFLGDLIETGLDIIKIVSPYVSNDAPEGYLCDVSLLEIFKLLNLGDAGKCNIEVEAHVARMLLVCCWRSMKEVSLLIGIIVSSFSNLTNNSSKHNSLPVSFIMNIWNMFCDILLRSKHAGAYELASLGFIKLCSVLWSSCSEELRLIPANAVTSLVNDLLDPVPLDKAQVTRRSAGLPFYLEALCITEPLIKDKQSFKSLMRALTDLCEHKMVQHDVNKIVISLNILRAFYKNAKLREDVFPYVSSGIIISINGFASSNWAIRNSCTLLFSALMQRIFGVKKCKMTGREFFSRFPRLYTFLLDQAKYINESLDSCCNETFYGSYHPSLFPVLLLLSHLYPSTIETSNFLMRLDNFIPYVMRCGSNAVYKTRTMAAKALVPLVSLEQAEEVLTKLISQIQLLFSQNGKPPDQNFVHGSLLQFKFVLERCFALPKYFANLKVLLECYTSMSNLCLGTKVSFVIKSLYFEILTLFLQNGYTDCTYTALPLSLYCLYFSTTKESKWNSSPGYALFLKSAIHYVHILFKFTDELDVLERRILAQLNSFNMEEKLVDLSDMVVLFMSSNDDNVVLGMLNFIDDIIKSGEVSTKVSDVLFNYVYTRSMKHHCFAKALSTFGLLVRSEHKSYQYTPQILHRIFDDMSTSMSDEIRTAAVKFSVIFILKLDTSSKQKVNEEFFNILEKLWKFLDESCKPEQCESCREETVSVLCLNPQSSVIFESSQYLTYRYFNCCIKLLKDPSSHIRDVTAEVLTPILYDHVRSGETYIPHATLVLDALFKEKIAYQVNQDPQQGILYLISLMLDIDLFKIRDWLNNKDTTSTQYTENSEESKDCELLKRFVVYEESKENPYYDLKEICELSCNVLEGFYTSCKDTQVSFLSTLSNIRTYYDIIIRRKNDLGWMYVTQFVK